MAKETINRNGRKTGEAVAATIRRRIANGELAIGDRLPTEDELTEAFGIARTTLREALRILESQGLIHIRRGRGGGATITMPDLVRLAEPLAVVLQLRKTTTADLDAARVLIEPHLAAELARNHTDDDLAALSAVLARASAAAEAADADEFGAAAAELHVTLIERGGNETLSVLSQLLNALIIERYKIGAHQADQALRRRAVRSYKRLYGYIEAGDATRAATHWEKQMQWVSATTGEGELLDVFDEKLPQVTF
jgi:GntR family transcriptional regulator, transcriptional repressor for pyruvate dehydrogenase complex